MAKMQCKSLKWENFAEQKVSLTAQTGGHYDQIINMVDIDPTLPGRALPGQPRALRDRREYPAPGENSVKISQDRKKRRRERRWLSNGKK